MWELRKEKEPGIIKYSYIMQEIIRMIETGAKNRAWKEDICEYIEKEENLKGNGLIITEFGDKFMLIKWERFKK